MYESYFGFEKKPFSLLPDARFLYLSEKHSLALTMLRYGMESRAFITVITGDIGCGKTTLCRKLLDEVPDDVTVGLITNTHSAFGDPLKWVLLAFDLDYRDKSKVEQYEVLVDFIISQYAQNKHTVLIVDEAQNLDETALEELRMLSNINVDEHQLLQLVLVGQPELRDLLKKPELRQFAQRVSADYHILPLSLKETSKYIVHRLNVVGGSEDTFLPETYPLIHRHSNGVPRLINIVCDTALVYAYGEQTKTINSKLIKEVISDREKGIYFNNTNYKEMAEADEQNSTSEDKVKEESEQEGIEQGSVKNYRMEKAFNLHDKSETISKVSQTGDNVEEKINTQKGVVTEDNSTIHKGAEKVISSHSTAESSGRTIEKLGEPAHEFDHNDTQVKIDVEKEKKELADSSQKNPYERDWTTIDLGVAANINGKGISPWLKVVIGSLLALLVLRVFYFYQNGDIQRLIEKDTVSSQRVDESINAENRLESTEESRISEVHQDSSSEQIVVLGESNSMIEGESSQIRKQGADIETSIDANNLTPQTGMTPQIETTGFTNSDQDGEEPIPLETLREVDGEKTKAVEDNPQVDRVEPKDGRLLAQEPIEDVQAQLPDKIKIMSWLDGANELLKTEQLVSPQGTNAYERYSKVLDIDPDNTDALAGIDTIKDKLFLLAVTAQEQGVIALAESHLQAILEIDPHNIRVLDALDKLNSRQNIQPSISDDSVPNEMDIDQDLLNLFQDAISN